MVIAMEEILKQTLLFDFYGELLTEHQRRIYEEVVLNDYSLSEVADELGISRQGVHDLVRRCNKLLAGYEAKLHLLERFLNIRSAVEEIQRITEEEDSPSMGRIRKISVDILKEL